MSRNTLLLAALTILAGQALAQQPTQSIWKDANQSVAEFPRGHIDVLKWEQSAPQTLEPAINPATRLSINSIADGVRLGWQAHPELNRPLEQLGRDEAERLANGQWLTLSPARLRKVKDANELLELAHDSRKALLVAIADEQARPLQQQNLQSVITTAELGSRLTRVGNWSKLQEAQQLQGEVKARQHWLRSQYAGMHSKAAVLKTLRLWARFSPQALQLPAALPTLPAQPISSDTVQDRLNEVMASLPGTEQRVVRSNSQFAYSAYTTAFELAVRQQDMLRLSQLVYDETVLRYNGMLLSTWDLLAASRALTEARIGVITTTRDFWLAEADLQWVLQGGVPERFVSLDEVGSGMALDAEE